MTTAKFKVETGIQLLARLSSKPHLDNFYSVLFENGLKHDNVVEMFCADDSTTYLLLDIISDAILPIKLGSIEAGALIFNTDSNMNLEVLLQTIKQKIKNVVPEYTTEETYTTFIRNALANLFIVNIYDATQFYTTIQNLESIIAEKNISLIIFDTLTAFYWSEQGFKITKMDVYIKTLISMIRKATKNCQVTVVYTRPEYFCSNKESIENLEVCSDNTTQDRADYRIHVEKKDSDTYSVTVKTCNSLNTKHFKVQNIGGITWF